MVILRETNNVFTVLVIGFLQMNIKEIILSGDHSEGVPPVPIPNTEVKPFCADGTALLRESRSLPGFFFVRTK